MFKRLIKFMRQKIEQNNHRARKSYFKRSLFSSVEVVLVLISIISFSFLGLVVAASPFVIISLRSVPVMNIIAITLLSFCTCLIIFIVHFYQFVLAVFFDLSFWDFLKYHTLKLLGLIVVVKFGAAIGSVYVMCTLGAIYYLVMFCYVYPTKFLRVYSDYNSENS